VHISTLCLKNYRAFRHLSPVRFGGVTTFIGANDSGKSCVVFALDTFFGNRPLQETDFLPG